MKYDECIGNINEAIVNPPSMIMSMRHYHTKRKSGNRGGYDTINTGVTEEYFRFTDWVDLSAPPDAL
mgnify:CR=1 FL=1